MKAERINKNQVRFTLNRADLKARQLKVTDLSYGSEKARALFDDMMRQAAIEFGFDLKGHPVMIEAIPVSEDSLMITMTQVNSQDDLISLFRSNIPGAEMGFPLENGQERPGGPGESMPDLRVQTPEEKPASEPETAQEIPVLYTFDSFESLLEAARTVSPSARLRNCLYRDTESGAYHLLVRFTRQTRALRYILTALTEFCAEMSRDPLHIAYIEERCQLSVGTRAIQKLSAMENS